MGFFDTVKQEGSFSTASGVNGLHYVVLQVTLKEKFYERKSFFDESKEIFSFIILNNKERAGGFRMQGI